MGTLLTSTICHYCNEQAKMTEDHIVPRARLPRPLVRLPQWFRMLNSVQSCSPCNNRKGMLRSDCDCAQCIKVWAAARAEGWLIPWRGDMLIAHVCRKREGVPA